MSSTSHTSSLVSPSTSRRATTCRGVRAGPRPPTGSSPSTCRLRGGRRLARPSAPAVDSQVPLTVEARRRPGGFGLERGGQPAIGGLPSRRPSGAVDEDPEQPGLQRRAALEAVDAAHVLRARCPARLLRPRPVGNERTGARRSIDGVVAAHEGDERPLVSGARAREQLDVVVAGSPLRTVRQVTLLTVAAAPADGRGHPTGVMRRSITEATMPSPPAAPGTVTRADARSASRRWRRWNSSTMPFPPVCT